MTQSTVYNGKLSKLVGMYATEMQACKHRHRQEQKGQHKCQVSTETKKRVMGIPYIHSMSQWINKVESWYWVNVAFTADNWERYARTEKAKRSELQEKPHRCFVNYTNKFSICHMRIVHKVPFICSRFYVQQTECGISQRIIKDCIDDCNIFTSTTVNLIFQLFQTQQ